MPARAFGRRPRSAPALRPVPAPDPAPGTPAAPAAPEPTPTPRSARPAAPADGAIAETVARLHPLIVRSLDMSKVGGLDNEALATQLLAFLETAEAETGGLSPLERQRVVTELVHDIKGLGPIEPLLQDAEISDILINGMHSTYVERKGRLEPVSLAFRDAQHLVHIAQRIAGQIGRRVDESSPMVDARLPDGSRVNIIIPPLALDGAAISIRRFVMRGSSLTDMAERGVLSPAMAEMFQIAVKARLNILISGGTGAGKTTFMNALSREIPDGERLVTIEDAAELQLQQPARRAPRDSDCERGRDRSGHDARPPGQHSADAPRPHHRRRDTRGRGAGDAPGDEHRASRLHEHPAREQRARCAHAP